MRQQLIEGTYRQVLMAWVYGPLEICGQIYLPLSLATNLIFCGLLPACHTQSLL